MLRWALWSLWEDRLVAQASACGIALALLLALYLDAVARGEADQIVAFPERAPADLWVLQEGVENLHMARSVLTDLAIAEVSDVPGVGNVVPLVYRDVPVGEPAVERVAYLVGIPPGVQALGPWDVPIGSARLGDGEVVAPAALAAASGLGIGDELRVAGRRLRIVGLSRGTFSMANPLVYTSEAEARRLIDRRDGANALLVRAAAGVGARELARRIEEQVDDVSVVSRLELVENDRQIGLQMGGAVVKLMAVVAAVVSALILGFTVFVFTTHRRRELAVASALGARRGALVAAAVLQSAVIALAGCLLAAAVSPVLGAILARYVPEVAVRFSARAFAGLSVATVLFAVLATLPPALRTLRLDPVLVFDP